MQYVYGVQYISSTNSNLTLRMLPLSSLANMHTAPYAVYFILLKLSELISMH